MGERSKIEWTEATWNPIVGCTKVSPGCKHCYAETLAERFRGVAGHPFEGGFDLRLVPSVLERPLRWKRGRLVFVNSMSDLFHEDVPDAYVWDVLDIIRRTPRHRYQILTKRAARMEALLAGTPLPKNLWLGVSVERNEYLYRAAHLNRTAASVRFLSLEPLLGPLPDLNLSDIDWVIVGGESGAGARPMEAEWVRDIRDRCLQSGVPFFFKQWGGVRKKERGRLLDDRTWDGMPEAPPPEAAWPSH